MEIALSVRCVYTPIIYKSILRPSDRKIKDKFVLFNIRFFSVQALKQLQFWIVYLTNSHFSRKQNRQERTAKDFATGERLENEGILCAFLVFQAARPEHRIRRSAADE